MEKSVLDLAAPSTSIIPEVKGTAYEAASVLDLLDMRAGIFFDEDYLAAEGPIIEIWKAQGYRPLGA